MRTLAIVAVAVLAIGASAASAGQLTVTSYDMNNGCGNSCGGTFNYWDGNYNGTGSTHVSNAPLSGGTGALTDGFIATDAWYNVSNESGTGQYVGWQTKYFTPNITFHFSGSSTVTSVNFYVDNTDVGGVIAPSSITIDGTTYAPTATPISAYAEELTISGLSLTGSAINIQPNAGSQPWIFVSEAQFFGSGVPEPSTWAMMLLGFAGLGFAGYRRAKGGRTAVAA
jgi:hypothetical protein